MPPLTIYGRGPRGRALQNYLAQEVFRRRLVRQRKIRLQGIEQVQAEQHQIAPQEPERLELEQTTGRSLQNAFRKDYTTTL